MGLRASPFLLACAVPALFACSGKNAQVQAGNGNNYSTTPCTDNCGADTQCQASCQDVSNQQPLPMGAQPTK
jgi:hypothetical protein